MKNLLSFLPAIIWASVVFVLSAVPGDSLPMPPIWNADKFAHIGVYFVLAATLIYGLLKQSNCSNLLKSVAWAVVISVLFGGILEILQQYIFIGRFGDVLDFLANSLGAVLAGSLTWLIRKK